MLEPFGQYFWNVGCWMKCLILLKSLHSTCNIQNFKYQICFSTIRMFCWMFWNWHCHLVFFVFFYINDKMALSSSELEIDVEKSPKRDINISKEEISKWKRNNFKKWSDELDTLIDLYEDWPVCGTSFFNDYLKKLKKQNHEWNFRYYCLARCRNKIKKWMDCALSSVEKVGKVQMNAIKVRG